MRNAHARTAADVVRALDGDATSGLSDAAARERQKRLGPNALPEAPPRSIAWVFLGQFRSPLIYLLLLAAVVAFALGHRSDAIVIAFVVVLNAFIGAFQEGRAERSLRALRKLSVARARVVRDAREQTLDARDLVPGDLLALSAGDAIAADARVVEAAALRTAEAALTGESAGVTKNADPLPESTALADRLNILYAGTYVTGGRGRAVVIATGPQTEFGRIAGLAETARQPQTPLERRVDEFGATIIRVAAVLFAAIFVLGFARGDSFSSIVMVALSQVVGLIPEGLPVALTIALAVGVQRMARRGTIVRRLAAVETLGSTTVICSDKTGTLTRNEMTVEALALPDGRSFHATGAGYEPIGGIVGPSGEPIGAADLRAVSPLIEAAVLASDASLAGPFADVPAFRPVGDPTEVALVALAMKAGVDPDALRAARRREGEIPFDPTAKLMATQHAGDDGPWLYLKGAPEAVFRLCAGAPSWNDETHARASRAISDMAGQALRVLAVGRAPGPLGDGGFDSLRGRVAFLGLVGEMDPPRAEVAHAIARCRKAGVRTVMVTGDHAATAAAIARLLGILSGGARPGSDAVVDGVELESITDDALDRRIEGVAVFARVHPAQKLRIVASLQRRRHVVAMTGDGVNDAPALAQADVGVAMGITGTDVAKEAAKVVVTDDDFVTIAAAVEEGRVVYRNIRKAVLLLVSTSAAEVSVLLLAMALGYPLPYAAVQILWNNLVTEGLITINLVMEPPEGDEMRRGPVPAGEPLLTRAMLGRITAMAFAIIASTLGWFAYRIESGIPEVQARAETFTLLAICEWFNVLNCRSETRSGLRLDIFSNPWLVGGLIVGNLLQVAVVFWAPLNAIFHTAPFSPGVVVTLGLVGSLVLWTEEARKWFARRAAR